MGPKLLAVAVAMVKAASYGYLCSYWLDCGGSVRYLGCRQSWWLWLRLKLVAMAAVENSVGLGVAAVDAAGRFPLTKKLGG